MARATGSALTQGPREQLGSPAFPRGHKKLHEPELAALSVASASMECGTAREPRGTRRKPRHFRKWRAAPGSVTPAGCWRKGPADGPAAGAGRLASGLAAEGTDGVAAD